MSLMIPPLGGASAGLLRAGQVRDVVAVSFSRAPRHAAPEIASDSLSPSIADTLKTRLREELGKTQTLLSEAMGGADRLAAWLDGSMAEEERAGLSDLTKLAGAIYKTALEAVEMLEAPQALRLEGPARQGLIDAAIVSQVDARLAAEEAAQEAALQGRLSLMKLFGPGFADRMEKVMRLGQAADRQVQRQRMIRDFREEVASGRVSVQVSTATLGVNAIMTVTPAEQSDVTVFSADRFEVGLATISLRMEAGGGSLLNWRG